MKRSKQRPASWGIGFVPVALAILSALLIGFPLARANEEWPPAPPLERPPERAVGLLPPSVTAKSTGDGLWRVTFRFSPPRPANSVSLAGSFNGWNPHAEPMTRVDDSGAWMRTTLLGPGKYQYKFVVEGNRWFHDPLNPQKAEDNFGGYNSVLTLGRLSTMNESHGRLGDEKIGTIGLQHDPGLPLYFQALGADRALLRYRTLAHDIAHIWVAIKGSGLTEMHVVLEDPLFAIWEARITLRDSVAAQKGARQITYTFVLADPNRRVSDPDIYTARVDEDHIFRAPQWAKEAVWYQILPDRFRNADPDNDPDPVRPWTSAWFTASPWETRDGQSFYRWFVFFRLYGGDIGGIEEKLPYLKELGVNALYLNPVFQAPTHHKYNTDNYLHVDEHLGVVDDYQKIVAQEDLNDPSTWQWTASDKRFLRFLKKAHSMDFRVIIDGVFNHVGTGHPAFQDVRRNGEDSKYADWFDIVSWKPFKYRGWAGHDSLPVFQKSPRGLASETLKQHIFNVTRRWMDPNGDGDPSDGIDGWRLDVPNEIPAPFWAEWREVVKSINPDAYITGEVWDRADTWLDGKHFDAVMNYEFARAAVAWICHRQKKIKPSELDQRLAKLRLAYPATATYVLQNLVDSHDTDRLASMALNPDRAYDKMNRVQDDNPAYDNAKPGPQEYRRARLLALLQMTYVGAPMIYYGDEVGMWGADDPTNRKPMLWEDLQPYEKPGENFVMKDQLEFYRRAVALRNGYPALRTGTFRTLLTDDVQDVWAFARSNDSERLIVVLNASDSPRQVRIPEPDEPPDAWSVVFGDVAALRGRGGELEVRVPPVAGVVLHAARPVHK
ncbi:MAG: alpha-amylase family glycosyl hydrolase [Phycisphaerae bacterium]